MSIAAVLLAVLAAGLFGFLGTSKIIGTSDMRRRAGNVNFTAAAYQRIGSLEVAGAAGVLLGLAWQPIGVAAGVGLVLLLVGALIAHGRSKASVAEFAPAVIFAVLMSAYLYALAAR